MCCIDRPSKWRTTSSLRSRASSTLVPATQISTERVISGTSLVNTELPSLTRLQCRDEFGMHFRTVHDTKFEFVSIHEINADKSEVLILNERLNHLTYSCNYDNPNRFLICSGDLTYRRSVRY